VSLPRETLIELMALADGELEGSARERVERLVAEDDEARRVVEAIRAPGGVGAWLGDAVQARSAAADGIADVVMTRLEEPDRQQDGVAKRVAFVASRRSPARVASAIVGAAFALAAGVFLYLRSDEASQRDRAPVASVETPATTATVPAGVTAVAQQGGGAPSQGVQVDEIDSPSRGVSVFEIPLGSAAAAAGPAGPSSVVIWIDEDPAAAK
jgi:anti-sigma factor RsiW